MENDKKDHRMDQAQYTYQLFNRAYLVLREIAPKPEKEDSTGVLVISLLSWIANTLNSPDAFLLSWPDGQGQMQIQEPAYINTPALKERKALTCFDRLHQWINSDGEYWVLGDTSGIPELYSAHIESCIVTKVLVQEDEFQGKVLLIICNRDQPALEEEPYIGYDRLFLCIGQWMLLLYISDLYNLANKRYQDAKARYSSSQTARSLALVEETSRSLLSLYSKYCAIPSWQLLYDYLDARIALFNAKEISEDELRNVLDSCRKEWLIEFQMSQSEKAIIPIRCALARGYFTLGIEQDDDWVRGKKLLGEHRELQREND